VRGRSAEHATYAIVVQLARELRGCDLRADLNFWHAIAFLLWWQNA
jgi:hypothetical protein